MPLSEHEQRLLNEIEQALYAEDPKFASSVRSARPPNRARLMLVCAVLGIISGLILLAVGLMTNVIALGVAGVVLIVLATAAAVGVFRGPRQTGPMQLGPRPNASRSKPQGLRTKMEDRMRRRFDER